MIKTQPIYLLKLFLLYYFFYKHVMLEKLTHKKLFWPEKIWEDWENCFYRKIQPKTLIPLCSGISLNLLWHINTTSQKNEPLLKSVIGALFFKEKQKYSSNRISFKLFTKSDVQKLDLLKKKQLISTQRSTHFLNFPYCS